MKKFITLIIAIAMIATLATGCGVDTPAEDVFNKYDKDTTITETERIPLTSPTTKTLISLTQIRKTNPIRRTTISLTLIKRTTTRSLTTSLLTMPIRTTALSRQEVAARTAMLAASLLAGTATLVLSLPVEVTTATVVLSLLAGTPTRASL